MTTEPVPGFAAVSPHEIDKATRLRVAANLRLLRWRFQFETDAAMADRLSVSRGVVNRALKGERTVGLDFLLKVHRALHVSIDWLVDTDPGSDWHDPDYVPRSRDT